MESVISYLTVLPESKEQRQQFIEMAESEILSGNRNPLEFEIALKSLEELIKEIRKLETVKRAVLNEADKYHEKTFDFRGYKITKTSRSTYDFSTCNDYQWNELKQKEEAIKETIKQRETFLKSITNKFDPVVNSETGEIIYPPALTIKDFLTIK